MQVGPKTQHLITMSLLKAFLLWYLDLEEEDKSMPGTVTIR